MRSVTTHTVIRAWRRSTLPASEPRSNARTESSQRSTGRTSTGSARRAGRCLLGSSFGAVAALSAAYRAPDVYGALVLMSGSFVFTDIAGADHGGGPVFDPVVRFVNRYRERPRRVADRLFVGCGVYEPLITANRSMVPRFESAGMAVRFLETRDGHSWENWRDSLRDALSWVYPGPQKLVYE